MQYVGLKKIEYKARRRSGMIEYPKMLVISVNEIFVAWFSLSMLIRMKLMIRSEFMATSYMRKQPVKKKPNV